MTGCSGPNKTLLMQAKDVVLGLEAQVLGPDLGLGAQVFVTSLMQARHLLVEPDHRL